MGFATAAPTLRFAEFKGEAEHQNELKSFEEIFLFSSGKNIKQQEASPDYLVPCVRYGELYHMYNEVIYTVINKTNLDRSELKFSEGDEILLPSAGEDPLDIGSASALTLKGVAIGRTINILKPAKPDIYDQIFVSYYINQKLRKKISTLARGASISNVYNSDLKTLEIRLPTLPEQRKIADFLTAVDQRIAQLKQKKALLTEYKKGVMQQLFAQTIRFKDDDGKDFPDWKESEFMLIAEKSKAKHNSMKSDEEWQCVELESLSQNTGKLLEVFNSSDQKSVKNKFITGEVLFGKLRPYLRKFLHADFEGVCSSEIWVLRGKAVTNSYLYQLIQTHKFNQAANVSSGSKMPRSDWEFISSTPFNHPSSSDEQTKIANFLSALDTKIESVDTQITDTQTFKRGLLQQMFV